MNVQTDRQTSRKIISCTYVSVGLTQAHPTYYSQCKIKAHIDIVLIICYSNSFMHKQVCCSWNVKLMLSCFTEQEFRILCSIDVV